MSYYVNKGVEVEHSSPSSDYRSLMYTVNRRDITTYNENENGNQGTECNLTSVIRCVEVEHLKESIDQGTLMYSQICWWGENLPLMIASLKALNGIYIPIPE